MSVPAAADPLDPLWTTFVGAQSCGGELSPVTTSADEGPAAGGRFAPFAAASDGSGRSLHLEFEAVDGCRLLAERAILVALEPAIARARIAGVECFFCRRRSPGLCLTFLGKALTADNLDEVAATAERLLRGGPVTRAIGLVFRPDVHPLGGPAAATALLRYFDADTSGWLSLDRLLASPAPLTPRSESLAITIAAAVLDDLFHRCEGSPAAVVPLWRGLAAAYRVYRGEAIAPPPPTLSLANLAESGEPLLATLAQAYTLANHRLAADLREIAERGELRLPAPHLLRLVAEEHCGRLRLRPAELAGLARSRAELWQLRTDATKT